MRRRKKANPRQGGWRDLALILGGIGALGIAGWLIARRRRSSASAQDSRPLTASERLLAASSGADWSDVARGGAIGPFPLMAEMN